MANFTNGNLNAVQLKIDERFAKAEMRMDPYPITSLMFGNAPFIIGDFDDARKREDRDTEVHMITRTKRATGNERVHNHQGARGDSIKLTPTFSTYSDTYSISLKMLDNNVFNLDEMMANGFYQCMVNILEDIEADNAAWLNTERTQYLGHVLKGGMVFNADTDTIEVEMNDMNKMRFFDLCKSGLYQDNYRGPYDFITDNNLAIEARWLQQQKVGNQNNTSFQFANMNMAESNNLVDPNYANGIVIGMQEKSVCLHDWIPLQNRNGHGNYASVLGGYGVLADPFGLGWEFAVHGYAGRADTSAKNGRKQDDEMEFEVSIDISRNKSLLSGDNGETVIKQFAFKAA